MKRQDLREAAEVSARQVLEGHLENWTEGAIFPSEIAFFLACCELEGLHCVIESGRQDGYSTAVLGEWASQTGRHVVSIDLEADAERALACRARLAQWPVELIRGSAYGEFGRAARANGSRRTGFLVDGPKGWPAISMMSAALHDNVQVVALHNLAEGLPTRRLFLDIGGPKIFYEFALEDPPPAWRELRARETELLARRGAARSLDRSSLGVLRLDSETRHRLKRLRGRHFGLHQPQVVRGFYEAKLYGPATKLYGLSYKLFGL